MKTYQDIWVVVETLEGAPRRVALELLGKARELAQEKGWKTAAVLFDAANSQAADTLIAYGADTVYSVSGVPQFQAEGVAKALEQLVETYAPAILLVGATPEGRTLSGLLSASQKLGLAADATDLFFSGETVMWLRPAYDGKAVSSVSVQSLPQMGTVRPGTFPLRDPDMSRKGDVVNASVSLPDRKTTLLEVVKTARADDTNLEEAKIIVSGGRGVGSAENFSLLYDLAAVLGGVVGASRVAVDEGWISYDHQVGVTGKTVSPRLYIACGISGAAPHVGGMSNADVIVAINTDPAAPIFEIAHYGIVGDLHEILPQLTAELKAVLHQ